MFDRPGHGTEAVLVSLDFGERDHGESLEEMQQLVASAGVATRAVVKGRRERPDAALFAGRGKVTEISESVAAHRAPLVIFNHDLSPVQCPGDSVEACEPW